MSGEIGRLWKNNGLIVDRHDGTKRWFLDDELHRDNGLPAVIYKDGSQAWYRHGKCHRDNDLPAIIWSDGSGEWYRHGKTHRENGPAIIWEDGSQWWYRHGKEINVKKWIKDNNLPSWEYWDDVTWSLFRLEFL